MNLFSSLFGSGNLSPEWSYTASGIVWRLLFTARGRIVGESRDQEKKTASFFCLDEESGRCLWQDLRVDEAWWVGMEGVQEDTLLLHGFSSPDMPEHRGIRAYDVETGNLLWRNDEATCWFGTGARLFAYRDLFERRVGYEIDLRSGEVKTTYDQSLQELHEIRRRAAADYVPEVTLPEILNEESAEPSTVAFVKRVTKGKDVAGNIEFIQQDDVIAFNYHVRAQAAKTQPPVFENHLFVYELSRDKRVFSEIIGRALKAQVPDAFFLRKGKLFYIKDQTTLKALRVWK
ncbi:MAG: DUF4905 domain-containing protein [Ignavibacteriales bacterium]|nr:DUF4905 domain-containing protein [Ignavibacteriales bacterium]